MGDSPVPNAFPHGRQQAGHHEVPEEGLNDDPRALQVAAIHVDGRDTTDGPTGRHEEHPVPLPSPADGAKPLLLRQEQLAVLVQADQRQHDGHGVQHAESEADAATLLDAPVRKVARGAVDDAAVRVDLRHVGNAGQGQVAP